MLSANTPDDITQEQVELNEHLGDVSASLISAVIPLNNSTQNVHVVSTSAAEDVKHLHFKLFHIEYLRHVKHAHVKHSHVKHSHVRHLHIKRLHIEHLRHVEHPRYNFKRRKRWEVKEIIAQRYNFKRRKRLRETLQKEWLGTCAFTGHRFAGYPVVGYHVAVTEHC